MHKRLSCLLIIVLLILVGLKITLPLIAEKTIGYSLLINKSSYSKVIYDKNHNLLRINLSSDDKLRIYSPLNQISDKVVKAVLSQEDQYFYWHFGVNPISALRAAYSSYFSGRLIGASTISMQVARLRYRINSKNIPGKLQQVFYAILLELLYSKDQILEAYLNMAPFGGNIEGIEAASFSYFSKKNSEINCAEAIALAVIPQNPNKRLPDPGNQQHLSAAFKLAESLNRNNPDFCPDYLQLLKVKNYQKNRLPFEAQHLTQRLIDSYPQLHQIHSSIDKDLQSLITRVSRKMLEGKEKLGLNNASVLLVENSNLKVRAYLGSADFWSSKILGQNDGIRARRSPGSALKPFLYALALDAGIIHPLSLLKDTEFSRATYNPENFEKDFIGPINATQALIRSRNIPAVSLLNSLSPLTFYNFLKIAGIQKMREVSFYGLSLALGGVEVSLEELASLYASLANGGQLSKLNYLEQSADCESKKIFSAEAAYLTLQMLKENERPVSSLISEQIHNRPEVAWKTGTSFGFRDAWAAGVFDKYTLVVWIGNFDGTSNPAFLGRDSAGLLFFKIVDALSNKISSRHFNPDSGLNIKKVQVCSLSGDLPGPDCPSSKQALFIPGVSPITTCSLHRAVYLNPESSLISCNPDKTKLIRKVYEFWPSDLAKLFEQAGLARASPPAYQQNCQINQAKGAVPLISSPQASIIYQLQNDNDSIALSAVTDADSKKSFWFADDSLIGEANSAETIFWKPKPGKYLIRVVDSMGLSNQVEVIVKDGKY